MISGWQTGDGVYLGASASQLRLLDGSVLSPDRIYYIIRREAPDGTVYRDEALERDILQEWVACYGAPPTADWAWEVLDELTYDYLEDESHELEHLHAA